MIYELQSKLLKGGYIDDYIWEYYRAYLGGILGVKTIAHMLVRNCHVLNRAPTQKAFFA